MGKYTYRERLVYLQFFFTNGGDAPHSSLGDTGVAETVTLGVWGFSKYAIHKLISQNACTPRWT